MPVSPGTEYPYQKDIKKAPSGAWEIQLWQGRVIQFNTLLIFSAHTQQLKANSIILFNNDKNSEFLTDNRQDMDMARRQKDIQPEKYVANKMMSI